MTEPNSGTDWCVECGELSDCVLPARFPHICHQCLFPAGRPEDPRADSLVKVLVISMAERLHMAARNAPWLVGRDRLGARLPESFTRRRWEP